MTMSPEQRGHSPRPGVVTRLWRWWRKERDKWRAFGGVAWRFAPYVRNRKWMVGLALGFTIAVMLMRVLEPWPIKLIIDNVLLAEALPDLALFDWLIGEDGRLNLLYVLAAGILVIAFGRGFFYYRQRLVRSRLGIEIVADLRRDLYTHIQHLSLSFHDRKRTGDLLVRLTSDIRIIRIGFISLPLEFVEGFLLMLGMAIVMLIMDWQLAILALALVPMLVLMVRRYHRPMKQAVRKQREREGHLASMAAEALGAMKVVQGFRREKDEIKRFGGANRSGMRSEIKAARFEAKLSWAIELSIALVTALIVMLAARRILVESLSPGDLIIFVMYLRTYAKPFRKMSRATLRVARVTAGGERILEILDTDSEIQDRPDAVAAPRFTGEIRFEGVSFTYGQRGAVLRDVDLTITAGERIALIGPTGAGKSTIVSLVPRFYDPTEGRVCIDGRDIREYMLSSLRKQVSLVFQEPLLFATSIGENIAYGKPDAPPEEVVKAARRAGIHRHIEKLRDGYDTIITERGGSLSGGERQCVAIARAMISKAPIVILDEPTVGLDGESAELVIKALDRLMRGRTVIMISHDLNAVRDVDRVIVLADGRIAGEGPHSPELVRDGFMCLASKRQAG